MRTTTSQFALADLFWFLFGAAAFALAWSPYNSLGGITSAALLAVFYWRLGARDILVLHSTYASLGLIAAALLVVTSACGAVWPQMWECAWWAIQACTLAATLMSFAVYLLSLLARQI